MTTAISRSSISPRSTSMIERRCFRSRLAAGSSSSNTAAICVSVRASSTRCLSPPDSVSSCRASNSPVSVRSIAVRAISRSPAPSSSNRPRCGYLPIRTVSNAVKGWRASCCGMNAIRLARSPTAIAPRTAPSSRTSPASGFSSPAITRSRVLLPAPLGPNSPSSSPGRTSRDAESRILAPPSRSEMSRASSPRPALACAPYASALALVVDDIT